MNKWLASIVLGAVVAGGAFQVSAQGGERATDEVATVEAPAGAAAFRLRVVAAGLEQPWEVTWGPDGFLWVTERTGKRVTRVDPSDGSQWTALVLDEAHQSAGQDGLLGMALHPELLQGTGHDYVYLAFTYDAGTGGVLDRRLRIRRYDYDASSQTLVRPFDLIDGLPASNDHNSGRLVIGPDRKLYYTLGDQGNNQFNNKCRPIRAQELPSRDQVAQKDWSLYPGKILRMNLDGSIPRDNPRIAGTRSHVFSYGHRNAQGIVFGPTGLLYESEHGPKTDDEVNIIRAGRNYGWPHVAGYQDDLEYVYGNWSASPECASLAFDDYVIPASVPQALESSWPGPFVPPIRTLYTVAQGFNFHDPACAGNDYICWPTVAPASIDLYPQLSQGVPGWSNSLLLVSLKRGSVLRMKLARGGRRVVGEAVEVFRTINRYRDIAIAPSGRAFYVVTDSSGQTSGPTAGYTAELEYPGAILEFAYAPPEPAQPPMP